MTEEVAFSAGNCRETFQRRYALAQRCTEESLKGQLKDVQDVFDCVAAGPTSNAFSVMRWEHEASNWGNYWVVQ